VGRALRRAAIDSLTPALLESHPMNWKHSALLGVLLANPLAANPPSQKPTLLLDATLIERSENIRIAVGRPEKFSGNPLFGEDRPWEPRIDNMYPNVAWDPEDHLFKCWYSPFLVEVEDWMGSTATRMRWLYRQSGLCYATSRDGIRWEKPPLTVLPYQGKPSNILLRNVHGVGVFRDEREARAERRFKQFFVSEKDGRRTTVAVGFSPDGVHWSAPTELANFTLAADTHNNALWAPTLNRYVAFTRDWDRANPGEIKAVRLVARTESADFEHWTEPKVVLRGLADHLQVYALPVFYHAGLYLGLPTIFNLREDRVHVELAWSKDTITWHRVDAGTPFIPNGEKKGAYDWGCVYPAATPIIAPDGVKLYYSGSDGPHYGERSGCLALATLRPDGFAAATPVDPTRDGTIVTVPVTFHPGDELRLTADTEPAGQVQVALLDRDGRELARSAPMTGSFTARPVVWAVTPPKVASEVRLKFTLSRARLYSYERLSLGRGRTGE
jgi:hypothetical protein